MATCCTSQVTPIKIFACKNATTQTWQLACSHRPGRKWVKCGLRWVYKKTKQICTQQTKLCPPPCPPPLIYFSILCKNAFSFTRVCSLPNPAANTMRQYKQNLKQSGRKHLITAFAAALTTRPHRKKAFLSPKKYKRGHSRPRVGGWPDESKVERAGKKTENLCFMADHTDLLYSWNVYILKNTDLSLNESTFAKTQHAYW